MPSPTAAARSRMPRSALPPTVWNDLWRVFGGILVVAFGLVARPAEAQPSPDVVTRAALETRALTRADVRTYIRLRVATHQMQERYRANAEQYDDVIQAFFQERDAFLRQNGWTGNAFDRLEERITSAQNMMAEAARRDSTAEERKAEREDMLDSPYLSDAQKATLREQLAKADSAEQAIEASTRRDWPAVRPSTDALEHLTDYVAGNRPDPPVRDDRP